MTIYILIIIFSYALLLLSGDEPAFAIILAIGWPLVLIVYILFLIKELIEYIKNKKDKLNE